MEVNWINPYIYKHHEFHNRIREYIIENNIEEIYEREKIHPESYLQFQDALYKEIFQPEASERGFAGITELHDLCQGQGGQNNILYMFSVWGSFPLNMQNAVSAHKYLGLVGSLAAFAEPNFQGLLFTHQGIGWTRVCYDFEFMFPGVSFPPQVTVINNNNMESAFGG